MIYPSFISTAAMSHETTASIKRIQAELVDAQTELATGRHADAGLALGAMSGMSVSLRQEQLQIQTVRESNSLVGARLSATQSGLQNISDLAQEFLSVLLRAQSTSASPETIVADAKGGLKALFEGLNTVVDGQHLYAGVNTDVRPLTDYFFEPPPASRQSVADAFVARFGFDQSDPGVQSISGPAMGNFLDTEFANEFSGVNWSGNWSSAFDKNVRSRISRTELAEVSTNANLPVFRDLIAAYTMVADLGFEKLNDGARSAVIDKAVKLTGSAVGGIANVQSALGVTQERLTFSSKVLDSQLSHLTNMIDDIEAVDLNEVATRLSTLMTQMESAYSVTKRIHDLSILKFL